MSIWLAIVLLLSFLIIDWFLRLFLSGFIQKTISILIAPILIPIIALIYCYCLVAFFDTGYQMANNIYMYGLVYFVIITGIAMMSALKPKHLKKDGQVDRRYKGNSLVNEERGAYLFFLLLWIGVFAYLSYVVIGITPLELFGVMFKVK